jgi:hypothetical protein
MVNSLFQWIMTGLVALLHPFYVSVIEIQHNANEKNLDISVRVFTEDMESVLRKSNTQVDLVHPKDQNLNNQLINSYISSKLHISVDGKPCNIRYFGYELQQESVWCYFDIPNIPSFKKLDADCTLLYDFEKSQINIFHVKQNGTEKSFKLDFPKNKVSFDF